MMEYTDGSFSQFCEDRFFVFENERKAKHLFLILEIDVYTTGDMTGTCPFKAGLGDHVQDRPSTVRL